METKICTKCGLPKSLYDFNKRSRSKDGLRSDCKSCREYIAKEYRNTHKDELKESNNIWRKNNIKELREIEKKRSATYRKNNPEKVKEGYNNWRQNNPDYEKEKHRKNPHIKAWRNIIHNSLSRFGKSKEGHTIDLLGYSALDLRNYIISLFTDGMSWDNYGEWHIDHIRRVNEFNKDTHPSIVNALTNLRPLWATTREINGIVYEGNLNRG